MLGINAACVTVCSPTPKTGSPSQSSKTQVMESSPAAAPSAGDKDDRRDDSEMSAAAGTKQPTPPRPR